MATFGENLWKILRIMFVYDKYNFIVVQSFGYKNGLLNDNILFF